MPARNKGLFNAFFPFFSPPFFSYFTSPLWAYNSALLDSGRKLGAGKKRQRSGTRSERDACCFCTADGYLVALPPPSCPPLPFLLTHSLTPSLSLSPPCSACSASPSPSSAAVLPSNQGLEQSEQGQSDSGSRLADDLLAGLESSEPRQLKWSLKLEPTCREGRREPARERKREGGRARMQLLCGDERAH